MMEACPIPAEIMASNSSIGFTYVFHCFPKAILDNTIFKAPGWSRSESKMFLSKFRTTCKQDENPWKNPTSLGTPQREPVESSGLHECNVKIVWTSLNRSICVCFRIIDMQSIFQFFQLRFSLPSKYDYVRIIFGWLRQWQSCCRRCPHGHPSQHTSSMPGGTSPQPWHWSCL